jgi:hypothetical protein
MGDFYSAGNPFTVYIKLKEYLNLYSSKRNIKKGDTVLIPAAMNSFSWKSFILVHFIVNRKIMCTFADAN